MKLSKLLLNLDIVEKVNYDEDIEIDNIYDNSCKVTKNSLFICISGYSTNGENYAYDAEKNGAVVIVSTKKLNVKCTQIIVKDDRKALSIIASNYFDNSHRNLKMIGVVGTNGKSSCSQIIFDMLKGLNKNVGLIGTNIIRYNDEILENSMTTPDPIKLHKTLNDMEKAGVSYVVMEVSAHAIYLSKVYGIKFETLLFTNISQDHLDFFKTMENYANVKMDFFNLTNANSCVINIDDDYGQKILLKNNLPCLSYGLKNPSDIFAIDIKLNLKKSSFIANICDDIINIESKLIGLFNVYNVLGAIGVLKILDFKIEEIIKAVKNIKIVEGRFNSVDIGQNFNVIIDYAHTPKSLEVVLNQVKKLTRGNIITIFGCPGNRDETKRSIMGEIAGTLSNFVIITTDNPQYENVYRIIREIEQGVKQTDSQYLIVEDRKMAIRCALSICDDNSTLLVVGKGAESYQNVNGYKIHYCDEDVVKECLEEELKTRKVSKKRK
mgnify:FL=1